MSQAAFHYRALDGSGNESQGVLRAATKQDAYRRLAATGLTPVRIRKHVEREESHGRRRRRRVKSAEISHFTYQLSVLLEARIPVVDCFRSIAEQEQNETLRRIVLEIAARVQSGQTITSALEPHKRLFGSVYLETVRAAEQSGNMISVLAHLAESVEEQQEMRRLVKGALMYPMAVLVALTMAITFLIVFVVPRFGRMFVARGVELPFLTQALMTLGESVKSYWHVYTIVIGGIVVGGWRLWKLPKARSVIDRYLHRIPYLKGVLVGLAVGRFASVFGLCLGSGLGLIESLEMSGRATGRPMLMDDVSKMVQQVRQGGKLGDVLKSCAYLPGFVKQLLRAGEESAELTKMCRIIARHYSRETKHSTKNLSTVLEPVLIAMLTGAVLVVALAVFLPMWDMVSIVG